MAKWIVPVAGKLIVEAETQDDAQAKAKAYVIDRNLSFLTIAYGVERVEDTSIIPVPVHDVGMTTEQEVEA